MYKHLLAFETGFQGDIKYFDRCKELGRLQITKKRFSLYSLFLFLCQYILHKTEKRSLVNKTYKKGDIPGQEGN